MPAVSDKIYLLLEIEKLRQDHGSMPTTFVFPTGMLELDGIVCCKVSPSRALRFRVRKSSLEDSWKVLVGLESSPLDFGCDSLSDTLLQLNEYVASPMVAGRIDSV